MKNKPKICVCVEMETSVGVYTAKTWQCPVHGQITVDNRVIVTPPAVPFIPIQSPGGTGVLPYPAFPTIYYY